MQEAPVSVQGSAGVHVWAAADQLCYVHSDRSCDHCSSSLWGSSCSAAIFPAGLLRLDSSGGTISVSEDQECILGQISPYHGFVTLCSSSNPHMLVVYAYL